MLILVLLNENSNLAGKKWKTFLKINQN